MVKSFPLRGSISLGANSGEKYPKDAKGGRRSAVTLLFAACSAQLLRCDSMNHLGLTISTFPRLETFSSCLSPVTTYLAEPATAHAKNLSSSGSLQTGSGSGGAWTISAPIVRRFRILATSTPENSCANSSATRCTHLGSRVKSRGRLCDHTIRFSLLLSDLGNSCSNVRSF